MTGNLYVEDAQLLASICSIKIKLKNICGHNLIFLTAYSYLQDTKYQQVCLSFCLFELISGTNEPIFMGFLPQGRDNCGATHKVLLSGNSQRNGICAEKVASIYSPDSYDITKNFSSILSLLNILDILK